MSVRNLWVLPMGKKYTLYGIASKDCVCDNCGRIISNTATIIDNDGNSFNVGMDCFDTLSAGDITNYFIAMDRKKQFNNFKNNTLSIARAYKKWEKIKVVYQIINDLEYVDIYFNKKTISNINIYPAYKNDFIKFVLELFWINKVGKDIY